MTPVQYMFFNHAVLMADAFWAVTHSRLEGSVLRVMRLRGIGCLD